MIERARHKPTACLSYVHNQYMYSKLYDLMVWISPAFCVEARKWTGLYGRIWGWNVSPKTTCTYEGKQGGCFLRYFWDVVSGPRASFQYPPSTSPMFTVHLADVHRSPRRCSQCTVHRVQFTLHNVSRIYFIAFILAVDCTTHTTFGPSDFLLHRWGISRRHFCKRLLLWNYIPTCVLQGSLLFGSESFN